ncbi:MAG: type II secretion system minor pseudopilin GspK [Pseudomonadota bacterium]
MRVTSRRKQRGGVALAFALLMLALTTSIAVKIMRDVALDTRRTTTLLWQEQARLVALGAEDWIGDVLRQDAVDTTDDHLGELWAQELPPLPIEGGGVQGLITGELIDLQSKFNINNLIDAQGQPVQEQVDQFKRLLVALGLNPDVTDAIIDWMDSDSDLTFPNGAEDNIYTGRTPPTRTANQPFRSINELAVVEGIDKATMDLLRPHVTALPERTGLNVNTATPFVLQSLDENLAPGDVEQLLELRQETGFADVTVDFAGRVPQNVISTLETTTSYFELRSVVRIGTVRFTMYSLLYRNGQGELATVMRSFGSTL